MTTYDNEQLIQAYLRMVDEDDYAAVGSILTEDATWTIVPIGYMDRPPRDRIHGRRGGQQEAARPTLTH